MDSCISLASLLQTIKQALLVNFSDKVWIVAEISDFQVSYNNHCYLELIDRSKKDDTILAKSKATIWANTFHLLQPYFESSTGHSLRKGLKIMVEVSVEFHEVYGFALNITDIDPSYTVGEQALRRMEIIKQLHDEGVVDMNKELPFPLVPQRIAIISSPSAAGYGDFLDQLNANAYQFVFYTKLFPAIMQGDKAEISILNAFESIFDVIDLFDVVIIVRGGGSSIDLSCFDSYAIGYYVSQFPIPVLTGIGHERDDTVTDLVAHKKLKTPTAVADFLIGSVAEFDFSLTQLFDITAQITNKRVLRNKSEIAHCAFSLMRNSAAFMGFKQDLDSLLYSIESEVVDKVQKKYDRLNIIEYKVRTNTIYQKNSFASTLAHNIGSLTGIQKFVVQRFKASLASKEDMVRLQDPAHILAKGYTITCNEDGKPVLSSKVPHSGQTIITRFFDGETKSIVE